ncbi:MAG: Ig-like domain-containing protein, partial [Planctomycetota bacterium]
VVSNEVNVAITAPTAGSVIAGANTVTFNIDPETNETITSTQFSINGGTWTDVTNAPTSGGNWDDGFHTIDTRTMTNGSHSVQIKASDSNSHTGYSKIITLVVSNEVNVAITAPTAGSVIAGANTVTFNIDPETNETITSTQFYINGGTWTDVTNAPTSGGNWDDGSHTWNTLALTNGSHTVQVRAQDSGRHWGYSQVTTFVVSNGVVVSLSTPVAGSTVNSVQIVTWTIDPETGESITSTQISIDGGTWTDVTNAPTSGGNWDDGSYTWDTKSIVNGTHTLQVRAQDSNGRWGYSQIAALLVSNNIIVKFTAPAAGSALNGIQTVTFTIDPETDETITSTQISIDGGAWTNVTVLPTTDNNWDDGSYTWDTRNYVNGSHTLQIKTQDSNNHIGYSGIITVVISNEIAVSITAPAAGSVLNSVQTVTWTIDPVGDETITSTQISIDGSAWADVTTAPTIDNDWDDGSYTWDTKIFANGSHQLQIKALNSNGLWGYSRIISVIVSNGITVSLTTPTAGSVVSDVQTVTFTIEPELNETITSTQISIDGSAWTDVTTAPTTGNNWDDGSYTWDTRGYVNGSHTLQIKVQDSNNPTGYSEIRLVMVFNEVTVAITEPEAGDIISGTQTITIAIDPEVSETITQVLISIDGGDWVAVTTAPTAGGGWDDSEFVWDTTQVKDGAHIITVKAQDSNAHWGHSLPRLVIVDNIPPVITGVKVDYPFGRTDAAAGDLVLISARIEDAVSGVNDSLTSVSTMSIDGSIHIMVDDGTSGDVFANDGVYSYLITIATSGDGIKTFSIEATDNEGNTTIPVSGTIHVRNKTTAHGGCSLGSDNTSTRGIAGWFAPFLLLGFILFLRRKENAKQAVKTGITILFSLVVILSFSISVYAQQDETAPPVEVVPPEVVPQEEEPPQEEVIPQEEAPPQGEAVPVEISPQDTQTEEDIYKDNMGKPEYAVSKPQFGFTSPISIKGNAFLHSLVLIPAMEEASTLKKGAVSLCIGYNYSKWEGEETVNISSVATDVAFKETYFRLAYGFSDKIEFRALLPYSGWQGELELIKNGESVFERNDLSNAFGSATIGVKYLIWDNTSDMKLSASLTYKPVTGSEVDYLSTGATDTSIALMFYKKFELVSLNLNVGYTLVGEQNAFRKEADLTLNSITFFGVSAAYPIIYNIAAIAQIQGNTSMLSVDALDQLATCNDMILNGVVGVRYALSETTSIEAGVGFGLSDSSSDIIAHIALNLLKF